MISFEDLQTHIRKLAKGNYWQTIYCQSKETSGLHLFANVTNFTDIQLSLLNNLSFYNSIYMDIALGDVTRIVLDDEIYEDSYMYFKNHERGKEKKKPKTDPQRVSKGKNKEQIIEKDQFVLRKSKT